ncbi:hypothetical protein [Myroides sp. WP-1]|uniref:hypothetical protein n=1 Tax=Myroides sp. WP-1 TaxID=2759944 RepID=UPI0015FB1DA0|nr:hypothetical protein [Myroides sp. WP-1]MBB1139115.1 hypothetical protein [Myroides sp. WP-1]
MKKKIIIGAFICITSYASAQTKVSSTSIGVNLGGLVSLVYDDASVLGLNDNQWKQVRQYQRDYESQYSSWVGNNRYSEYERNRKRDQLYKEIRIKIGDILTIEQQEKWRDSDKIYVYNHYHPYDHKKDHHYHKSNKYKNKHKKKHKHKHEHCD